MAIEQRIGHSRVSRHLWAGYVPLVAVMLSVISALGWLRWELFRAAEDFRSSFVHQNMSELAAGDTMALSRRLEAVAGTIRASCVVGRRDGAEFYRQQDGRCGTGLVHQQVTLGLAGRPDIAVDVTLPLSAGLAGAAALLVLGQLALLALLRRSTQQVVRAQMSAVIERERAESALHRAIAATTQMLAHDVRKPFSMLRMGLTMLRSAKDTAGMGKVLDRLTPEIERSVASVNGLLADLLEVGSTSAQLIQDSAAPESLIDICLQDILRVYPRADIAFHYDLRHSSPVYVHAQKVGRVFSNIVGNAIQAIGYKGRMWFATADVSVNGAEFVQFTVGNAGSVIPPESLPRLFEAFFTSGKKGGTGLGLAIAEKVVKAHGGRVWCESNRTAQYPEGYVEFHLTLPAAAAAAAPSPVMAAISLPAHSTEVTKALLSDSAEVGHPFATASRSSIDASTTELEAQVLAASARLGRPLRVLAVDDEPVYRDGLRAILGRTEELTNAVNLAMAEGSTGALAAGASEAHKSHQRELVGNSVQIALKPEPACEWDLFLTDIDLGPDSVDGLELVQELRRTCACAASLVVVSSNRVSALDGQLALVAGADLAIPKPIGRAQLLRLVLQAAARAIAGSSQAATAPTASRPELLVIDDDPFVAEAWEEMLRPEAIVHIASGLENLRELIAGDADLLHRLTLVVTDYYLDEHGDGLDVGRLLRGLRPDLPVLLSSDAVMRPDEWAGAVAGTIPKEAVPLAKLLARISN